jgi:AraC-like DNA-binding protein
MKHRRTELIPRACDTSQEVNRTGLDQAIQALVSRRRPERETVELLHAAAAVVARRGNGRDLAGELGLHPHTLTRRVTQAGLPVPRRLLAWLRILLAAHLLEGGATVRHAALACGYVAESGLRRVIFQFLGLEPASLRDSGMRTVIGALSSELGAIAARSRPVPTRTPRRGRSARGNPGHAEERIVLDLQELTFPGNLAFSARAAGEEVRRRAGVDAKDRDELLYEVRIPPGAITFSAAFFLGMFADSVIALGGKEFRRKYVFTGEKFEKSIARGIAEAAVPGPVAAYHE